ncbi:hypothetical protein [Nostoc sp.]|uniref:hypothetical protein n=1 Tax=Nostoc sp. TaxID=1180 RepID=UPI002FF6D364
MYPRFCNVKKRRLCGAIAQNTSVNHAVIFFLLKRSHFIFKINYSYAQKRSEPFSSRL